MKPKKPSTCVRWGLGPFTRIEVGWELYLVMPSHCSPYSQSFLQWVAAMCSLATSSLAIFHLNVLEIGMSLRI